MSIVNKTQVGGDHYRAELQHWDLIEEYGQGYLEGCSTKYITRWRKKNGLQDLEKAEHYLAKLLELHTDRQRMPRGYVPSSVIGKFAVANGLDTDEWALIQMILQWRNEKELSEALSQLRLFIARAKRRS